MPGRCLVRCWRKRKHGSRFGCCFFVLVVVAEVDARSLPRAVLAEAETLPSAGFILAQSQRDNFSCMSLACYMGSSRGVTLDSYPHSRLSVRQLELGSASLVGQPGHFYGGSHCKLLIVAAKIDACSIRLGGQPPQPAALEYLRHVGGGAASHDNLLSKFFAL